MNIETSSTTPNRRHFLQATTAAAVGGSLVGSLAMPRSVHADGGDTLKVGLIGCGGRGTQAAADALQADPNCKLIAMADLFQDRLNASRGSLAKSQGTKFAVNDDHCFVGFDSYKQLLATDVDVVLLTTPPHFRPLHLRAAVEAGKHIFCEKPVAVDGPGCRSVFETVEMARAKKLSLVSGLCWRYDLGVRETVKRILDGAIGDITSITENYLTGTLWQNPRQKSWSEMEYQCRNWLYYTWLSGDHIVEQHIHSLDKALWLNHDEAPLRCYGLGGRQVRTGEEWGHGYDHFAVCFDFPKGVKVYSYTRQMANCWSEVEDHVQGTKGTAKVIAHNISGDNAWNYQGPKPNMYKVEHNELFASIRSSTPINNGIYMTRSTLMAIMGRMACYSGKNITWDQALNSIEDLTPAKYAFEDLTVPEVALPGQDQSGIGAGMIGKKAKT